MDTKLIDEFEHEHRKLRTAIAGLTPEQMKSFPIPGTWSIQQIVIHVVDSAIIGTDRMHRIIALDNPVIQAYDETQFTKNLHYHEQSVEEALAMLELNNRQAARLLRLLPPETFSRYGIHLEVGKITLEEMLRRCVVHVDHHLKFIEKKRAMVMKG